jgi:hypothetical protein
MNRSRTVLIALVLALGAIAPASAIASTADPVAIPGGIETRLPPPYGPVLHVFAPGPTDTGFMGLDVDPSTITNFDGFTAMGHFNGTVTDAAGARFDLGVSGVRVYQGTYLGSDGSSHRGTFVFILIELYDPITGQQLHELNGGIGPSGLCWTVRVPDSALEVSENLQAATLHVENATAVETFQRFGPATVPATVSLDITWAAAGPQRHYKPASMDPTDPANFDGKFRFAEATGTISGSTAEGFAFSTVGTASTEAVSSVFKIPGWAEMGRERNGSFLAPPSAGASRP